MNFMNRLLCLSMVVKITLFEDFTFGDCTLRSQPWMTLYKSFLSLLVKSFCFKLTLDIDICINLKKPDEKKTL